MKRLAGIIILLLLVSACGSMVKTHQTCTTKNASYKGTWACINKQVTANKAGMMNNSQGARFMAYGSMLLEKVQNKKLSNAEAKSLLAVELDINNRSFNADKRSMMGTTTECKKTFFGTIRCKSD